jgi:hypothetical protein
MPAFAGMTVSGVTFKLNYQAMHIYKCMDAKDASQSEGGGI